MAPPSTSLHWTPSEADSNSASPSSSFASSSKATSSSTSSSSQHGASGADPNDASKEEHEHSRHQHHQHRKTRTLYNTFLSPSGSISFFSPSWFEFRPIKETAEDKAESVSASLSSALSSGTSAEIKRRPTYEEYRSQEPPQARLIRLRGLFDVLMDKDQREALADGRAKEAWTATARRARYGAGGKFARGSLAKEMHLDREMSAKEVDLDADKTSASDAAPGASGSLNASVSAEGAGSSKDPATPSPPRQSYASELLAQCRQCRLELENERIKRKGDAASASTSASSETWVPASLRSLWPGSSSQVAGDGNDSGSSACKPRRSPWYSITSSLREADDAMPEADHDGESGYEGSGVWGLSAVKGGSRDRERKRLREAESSDASDDAAEPDDEHQQQQTMIEWEGFMKYAETKERELYKIFSELDKNGDMRLDVSEIRIALDRAGISLSAASLEDFIASLSSSTRTSDPHAITSSDMWHSREGQPQFVTWPEFRDYLLLLPRKPSVREIFRFYQVRKAFGLFGIGGIFSEFSNKWGMTERHQATSLTSDGDVIAAGEEKKRSDSAATADERSKKSGADAAKSTGPGGSSTAASKMSPDPNASSSSLGDDQEEDEEEDNDMIQSDVALKFLLAGGIAGAVSRTATAPFDRLKIYLITASRSSETASAPASAAIKQGSAGTVAKDAGKFAAQGLGVLGTAVRSLYIDGGGLRAFWTGNGLNCVKIFPESAIKFLSYETSKRAFAKYVDNVSDSRDISGTSRFISGGIGGITSQLAIYPIETLKTRLMSSQGSHAPTDPVTGAPLKGNPLLLATAKQMWKAGGLSVYYRGLVAGLVGVFPYSAIDMSTFEGIKLAYISYTGKEEPGTLALLAFGSFSGSVGATTVYPLNLIRTRLQAAGTPAHPQVYDGFVDAVKRTHAREGVVGFYRGLIPTLAKVVPAVSISYVCYENSKKRLGVAS